MGLEKAQRLACGGILDIDCVALAHPQTFAPDEIAHPKGPAGSCGTERCLSRPYPRY